MQASGTEGIKVCHALEHTLNYSSGETLLLGKTTGQLSGMEVQHTLSKDEPSSITEELFLTLSLDERDDLDTILPLTQKYATSCSEVLSC